MEASYPGCSIKFTAAQIPTERLSWHLSLLSNSPTFTLFFLYEQDKTTQELQELWFPSDRTTEAIGCPVPRAGGRAASAAGTLRPRQRCDALPMWIFSRLQAAGLTPFQPLAGHCLWLLAPGHAEVFTGGSQGQKGSGRPGPRLETAPRGHPSHATLRALNKAGCSPDATSDSKQLTAV